MSAPTSTSATTTDTTPSSAASISAAASAKIPTAQVTASLRVIQPVWKSSSGELVKAENSYGESYHDRYAVQFLPPEYKAKAQADLAAFSGGMMKLIQAQPLWHKVALWLWTRTRALDSLFNETITNEAAGIKQVVILGAGFDTRLFRFTKALSARKIARFEVDLPKIQADKIAAIKEAVKSDSNEASVEQVKFVPFDFAQPKDLLLAALKENGYDPTQKTLFLMEGVMAYLTAEAAQSTIDFLGSISPSGSYYLVTFGLPDYSTQLGGEGHKSLADKGEPVKFTITAEAFTAMLAQGGWTVERMLTPDLMKKEYASPAEHTIESLPMCLAFTKRK